MFWPPVWHNREHHTAKNALGLFDVERSDGHAGDRLVAMGRFKESRKIETFFETST